MSTLLIQVLNPFAFLLASLLLLLLGLLSLLSSSTSCPQPQKRTGSQSLGRAAMQVRWLVRLDSLLQFWEPDQKLPCHISVAVQKIPKQPAEFQILCS